MSMGDKVGARAPAGAVVAKEICESCFEYLNIEMVDWVVNSCGDSKEDIFLKLERLGFTVGQRIAERATRSRARFQNDLERIKFICKEFWSELFLKQIDNLRTNHRGVFVLQDNKFRWLTQISADGPWTKEKSQNHVIFPAGLIRGALHSLGVSCVVTAETKELPSCTFTIKMISTTQ